jgi:uncharacterized protein YndB with AHSA1/START domain
MAGASAAADSPANESDVRDTSIVDQTGARLLRDEIRIHAPPSAIWRALTDQAAYRRWAAPASFIDLRIGGSIEVVFDPNGKPGDPGDLKQMITAYVPERLLTFRNVSNPGVPGGAAYGALAIVLQIDPSADGATKVSLSQVGYGQSKDFDALYAFFSGHNPEYLRDLKRFVESQR